MYRLILISVSLANIVSCNVPALLWTNRESSFETPLAGHTLSSAEFHNKYLSSLNQDQDLIVFVQDRLNLEDFTEHGDVYNAESQGGAFHNLKNVMESHTSAQVPSVNNAVSSIDKLKESFGPEVHHLSAPYSLKDLNLQKRSIINIHLPETGISKKSFHKALSSIDGIIGSVTDQLKAAGRRFTAIYTARDNSQNAESDLYTGRHLLGVADPTNDFTFFNYSSCIFLYAKSIQFQMLKNGAVQWTQTLPNINGSQKLDFTGSNCTGDGNALLSVKYPALDGNITSFAMKINFTLENRWWQAANAQVTYTPKGGAAQTVNMDSYGLAAPYDYSYKCTKPDPFSGVVNGTGTAQEGPSLIFTSLQVQPNVEDDKFSFADDCVGAFSLPIWMGLFSSLVLIIILLFGVTMIMSIQTQDRFDDPKGKPMVVNVME